MKYFTLFLVIIFFTKINPQELHDLIQPITLQNGFEKEILVSDLFYSDDYSLKFNSLNNFNIVYNEINKLLKVTPSENSEGFYLIPFELKNKKFQIPVFVEKKIKHKFIYKSDIKVNKVNLFGTFNSWNRENLPMEKINNQYELEILLEPGRYEYKFFVDGEEIIDEVNPDYLPNGFGGFNSILTLKNPNEKKLFLHIKEKLNDRNRNTIFFFEIESEPQIKEIDKNNISVLLNNTLINENNVIVQGTELHISLAPKELEGSKILRVVYSEKGITSNIQTIQLFDGTQAGSFDSPVTWNDAILYSIMIDRFYDGDKTNSIPVEHPELSFQANYQGGDIQGLILKLEEGYFDSLGINTIWISPVNDNTNEAFKEYPVPHRYYTGYHGYWPIHHERVEEKFGDMELLKIFISKAQEKGIKILLDFVANHVHIEHLFWEKHRDWFGVLELPDGRKNLRLWDEQRLTTWFEPYMPSFDFSASNEALEFMTDNAVWWLKETNADGFRHDAVKHVPNEFWRMLTKKIKKEIEIPFNKKVYQIGETFGSYELVSSYVNNGQLNSQFNFILYDTAIPVFLNDNLSFSMLDEQMKKTFSVYGYNNLMGNVLDSHDKVRFIAYADGDINGDAAEIGWNNPPEVNNKSSYDKLKVHLAYILSIPGIPIVYYGTEIGLTGAADPDNRRMMKFDENLSEWERETLTDVRKIINARKKHPAFRHGDFYTVKAEDNIYSYIRSDLNERILVVLNKSGEENNITLTLPPVYFLRKAENIFSSEEILIDENKLNINIPAYGYKFYKMY